jgi:hypothetical protein
MRVAGAWAAVLAIVLFYLFRSRGFDDPYITYRYAANLARGYGFVYNPGDRVLSTTTPLYALVLALVRLIGLDLPLASNAISCASLAIGGWALWRLCRAWDVPSAGPVAAFVYPTFPLLISILGAETAFYIALILLGFLAYALERPLIAAVLLALATLTRADGVLSVVVVGADVLLRRRPIPWRAGLVFGVIVAVWFAFALWYFGSPFPVTLAVKQRQALLAASQTFFQGFSPFVLSYWTSRLYRLPLVLAAAGMIAAMVWRPRFRLILAWSVLYFAGYSALGVTRYYWYYAPLVAGFAAFVGLGFAAIRHELHKLGGRYLQLAGTLALVVALTVAQLQLLLPLYGTNDRRVEIYHTVGQWIAQQTPRDASVGALEVGIIGYYADRRMIDFAGLIQPETAQQLTRTTTYEDAALWAIDRFHPDYLVLTQGQMPRVESSLPGPRGCRPRQSFSNATYGTPIVVYQCTGP